jgi:hypothetical protein
MKPEAVGVATHQAATIARATGQHVPGVLKQADASFVTLADLQAIWN